MAVCTMLMHQSANASVGAFVFKSASNSLLYHPHAGNCRITDKLMGLCISMFSLCKYLVAFTELCHAE